MLCWNSDLKPYRDITAYNFPGQTYEFWILGKCFGWGQTWPIYLFDAILLVTFGIVLVVWSRARLGMVLPGWIGAFTFLLYYLSLDYTNVAQREWHSVGFVIASILIIQAASTRLADVLAALLFAVGFSIRPYAVFFLPAAVLALAEKGRERKNTGGRRLWPILLWLVAFSIFSVLMFLPLILDGIFDDFLRGLNLARTSYGGRSYWTILRNFLGQLSYGNLAIYLGLIIILLRGDRKYRFLVCAWLFATIAAFGYRLIAPSDHLYLGHPLRLAIAVDVALLLGLSLRSFVLPAFGRLWLTLLLAGAGTLIPSSRIHANMHASYAAIKAILTGVELESFPPGGETSYPWEDYQGMLAYIREHTETRTRVANLLRRDSPSICGPTRRIPVFPVETPSLAWLWLSSIHTEADFIRFLESAEDSIVVWAPEESGWKDKSRSAYDELRAAVHRLYSPVIRLGPIEIRARRDRSPQLSSSRR